MSIRSDPVPDSMRRLQERLQQYRSTRLKRTKLPQAIWQAAVEEARQHGAYFVARTLGLDCGKLKKRLGGAPLEARTRHSRAGGAGIAPQRRRPLAGAGGIAAPAFVELVSSAGVDADEYVIEFEPAAGGSRMRVRWRGTGPEWSSLLRAWREVAG